MQQKITMTLRNKRTLGEAIQYASGCYSFLKAACIKLTQHQTPKKDIIRLHKVQIKHITHFITAGNTNQIHTKMYLTIV